MHSNPHKLPVHPRLYISKYCVLHIQILKPGHISLRISSVRVVKSGCVKHIFP